MTSYDVKRVADPVHGTIGLSELEVRVMETQVFQRLRNIKQLGLAHYVYPGADYSRLSHSLGACHVTGRILEALKRNNKGSFDPPQEDLQLYRLAGLLHDVGHYPFSHAMEQALEIHYDAFRFSEMVQGSPASSDLPQGPLNHEDVGKEIVIGDEELRGVLKKFSVDTDRLFRVFEHRGKGFLANIISSDLDADRIDYLLRTARHTGLPYGNVDLDYILNKMRLDEDKRVCIDAKAVRTADHFLLCRYFDYQQVSFHKTVAAFEWVLKDVISALLRAGRIKGLAADVKKMIADKFWRRFDDGYIMQRIIELGQDGQADASNHLKVRSILERTPPKLIFKKEYFSARGDEERKNLFTTVWIFENKIREWSNEFGIEPSLWHLWYKEGIAITNIGSSAPISSVVEKKVEGDTRLDRAIQVQDPDTNKTQPIVLLDYSLLKSLSNIALYSLRLYVLFPPGKENSVDDIKTRVQTFWTELGSRRPH